MRPDYNQKPVTALASAARTATTATAVFSGKRYRGVIVYLDVTAASGTGGLKVVVRAHEVGNAYALNAGGTDIITVTRKLVVLFPSTLTAAGAIQDVVPCPLPSDFSVQVLHADASSYTYSVSYELIG